MIIVQRRRVGHDLGVLEQVQAGGAAESTWSRQLLLLLLMLLMMHRRRQVVHLHGHWITTTTTAAISDANGHLRQGQRVLVVPTAITTKVHQVTWTAVASTGAELSLFGAGQRQWLVSSCTFKINRQLVLFKKSVPSALFTFPSIDRPRPGDGDNGNGGDDQAGDDNRQNVHQRLDANVGGELEKLRAATAPRRDRVRRQRHVVAPSLAIGGVQHQHKGGGHGNARHGELDDVCRGGRGSGRLEAEIGPQLALLRLEDLEEEALLEAAVVARLAGDHQAVGGLVADEAVAQRLRLGRRYHSKDARLRLFT